MPGEFHGEFQSPKPSVPSAVCAVTLLATAAFTLFVGTMALAAPKPQHAAALSFAPTAGVRTTTQVPISRAVRRVTRPSVAVSAEAVDAAPEQHKALQMPTVGPAEALNRKAKMWASAIHSLVALPIILLMSAWVWSRKCAKVAMAATTGEATAVAEDGEYKFATMLEEIPKGTRKLVRLQGANILIFWYRNELYAIENRSPAEGAFNQGFEQARFTQNYGILCPSTETEFNMKTGEVMTWLPNNAVLRLLTPPCPPLEVFPVKVEQGEVRVAVPDGGERAYFDGGATSSFERNNVFGIEPRMYLEDGTYIDDDGVTQSQLDPGIIVVTTLAVAIVAVAGTAVCLYIESIPALAAFWIVGFAIVGKQVLDYSDLGQDE